MKLLVALTILAVFQTAQAANWAVLVAGSKGYGNYRHQTDICHAYQILKNNGLHEDNIITLSYDDVANNYSNPFTGKLFNKPSSNGVDVRAGCVIDYSGGDATPNNFLAVLAGDASRTIGGNGKVLKSNSNDHVFIYFADHGGAGLIAFPAGGYLYESELTKGLKGMHSANMYGKLVFYLEACESGSMLVNLPTNINIYATSAANPTESSYAAYCSPNNRVNGVSIGSCLGDLYSINWMEDTDAQADLSQESLEQQFKLVRTKTSLSHVLEWGDKVFTGDPIGDFQSAYSSNHIQTKETIAKGKYQSIGLVDSRDVQLHFLMNQYNMKPTLQNYLELREEELSREYFDTKFKRMALAFGAEEDQVEDSLKLVVPITKKECQRTVMERFESQCRKFSDYGLKYTRFLVTVCESGLSQENINQTLNEICN